MAVGTICSVPGTPPTVRRYDREGLLPGASCWRRLTARSNSSHATPTRAPNGPQMYKLRFAHNSPTLTVAKHACTSTMALYTPLLTRIDWTGFVIRDESWTQSIAKLYWRHLKVERYRSIASRAHVGPRGELECLYSLRASQCPNFDT